MSTTPNIGFELLDTGQAQKELSVNKNSTILEALLGGVISRTETAPPGSPSEGDAYIVDATATGVWATHEDKIAYFFEGVWLFLPPETVSGHPLWVQDEAVFLQWNPGSPGSYSVAFRASNSAPVITESGTTYDVDAADNGSYIRFTNTSAKTVNVRDEADHALPTHGEWHIRNVGANDLTLVEDTAVTINVPNGGTLVLEPGMTVTLKRVAADEFDLFGQTVPA